MKNTNEITHNGKLVSEIVEAHRIWCTTDTLEGRADLRGADLHGVDLRGVDLRYANLSRTDLSYADLRGADLSGANLSGVDLRGVDLSYANLSRTDLSYADLRGADLRYADLSGASGDFSAFYGGRHHGNATPTHICIGCKRFTHAEWRENYEAIGAENQYSPEEIERYRAWIFSLDWLTKVQR